MTQPRSAIVSLEATPYYHCIARCVRRAFLCGNDRYTGQNFDHRKIWFIKRLDLLTKMFSIDIAAYAIMSNHYHVVLYVDKNRCLTWSQDEVIKHWLMLYKGPEIIHRHLRHEIQSEVEKQVVKRQVEIWRERLCSISWFMGCLNEYVARKANLEDNCKGRFWESRFKSQALLDETALLSCMAYVDLNPIRAGISSSLESSEYTSAHQRIKRIQGNVKKPVMRLMPFSETINQRQTFASIPFNLQSYLDLVDWTGRCVRNDKKGFITEHQSAILTALNLSDEQWQYLSLEIQKESICMLHGLEKIVAIERKREKQRVS